MPLLQVIEFFDPTNRSVVARVPAQGSADIKYGATLIVQQNQEAVFFRDGQSMDRFGPGRHTLTTANVPIVTRLLTAPWEKSPFRALVYFVGKQTFVNQKWGTRQPILFKDNQFGAVRLRSYGTYSFRVADSSVLINTLVGTSGAYSTHDVSSHLLDVIVSRMTDLLGSMGLDLVELPSRFDEIASATRAKVAEEFAKYGLELVDFFIGAISPPDEVQAAIDTGASMKAIGDIRGYQLYEEIKSKRSGGQVKPPAEPAASRPPNPQTLVRSAAQSAGWRVDEADSAWSITVPIGMLRRQRVRATFDRQDRDGHDLISLSSVCGPASEETAMALLRHNHSMAHAAFAIEPSSSGDLVVVEANQLAETADELEISRAIAAVAWQADQVEKELTGRDQF